MDISKTSPLKTKIICTTPSFLFILIANRI